jgi:hypothetical protein
MTNFPPSLSRVKALDSTKRLHREKMAEREEKCRARLADVEAAMKHLPLKNAAETEIPKMSGLFEQTYYAAVNKLEDKAASTNLMTAELVSLAKSLGKVANLVENLHSDTLKLWAAGSDPVLDGGTLLFILREAEARSEFGIDTLRRAKRIGGRGRTEDLLARSMKETAAFVYEQLAKRKANVAYDAYASRQTDTPFQSFLSEIFEIYGVKASAGSRARKRKRMTKK